MLCIFRGRELFQVRLIACEQPADSDPFRPMTIEHTADAGVGSAIPTKFVHRMSQKGRDIHPNAIETIKRHVAGSLANCIVDDGWPTVQSYYQHVEALAGELLKHKKDWLDAGDVYGIFTTQVYNALRDKLEIIQGQSGQLKTLLGENKFNLLTNRLTDFYCKTPIPYDVYLKFPGGNITLPSVNLTNSFGITSFTKGDKIPWGDDIRQGGLLRSALEGSSTFAEPATYFKSAVSGYLNYSHRNQTARRALTNFKIAIFQALSASLVRISNRRPSGLGLIGGLTHHSIEKHYIECVEQDSPTQRNSIELPIDFSLFLSRLEVDDSKGSPLAHCSGEQLPVVVHGIFKAVSALIKDATENARRIKSAIEWFIDSHTTESTTISFLQICIALEAIFGDENGREDGLTKSLADRCAYLIGLSIDERKIIRNRFENLYRVRSKIVHGTIASLNQDEQQHLEWGMRIARLSIQKEIVNLKLS